MWRTAAGYAPAARQSCHERACQPSSPTNPSCPTFQPVASGLVRRAISRRARPRPPQGRTGSAPPARTAGCCRHWPSRSATSAVIQRRPFRCPSCGRDAKPRPCASRFVLEPRAATSRRAAVQVGYRKPGSISCVTGTKRSLTPNLRLQTDHRSSTVIHQESPTGRTLFNV
jgi:hypothetical protein